MRTAEVLQRCAWGCKHVSSADRCVAGNLRILHVATATVFEKGLREEVLDCYVFETLIEVRRMASDWITRYNESRPREALGDALPRRYLMAQPR